MYDFPELITYMITALIVENALFSKAFALDNMFGIYKNKKSTISFSLVLTVMLLISTLLHWWVRSQIVVQENFSQQILIYEKPLLPVICMTIVYLAATVLLRPIFPRFYNKIRVILPSAAYNCTILGTITTSADRQLTLLQTMGYAVGMAASFFIASLVVSVLRKRVAGLSIPQSFQGLPIELIIVGIMSLALSAFTLA